MQMGLSSYECSTNLPKQFEFKTRGQVARSLQAALPLGRQVASRCTRFGHVALKRTNGRSIMKNIKLTLVLLCIMAGTVGAQEPKVTTLMTKNFVNIPDKEALMITVEYAPGGSDPIHRHNAAAFVYVLEGSVVMQVKGGKQVTLGPGETFYEGPDDIHIVGRNASNTKPAKFLVFLIKNPGAPVLVPVK